MPCCMSGPTPTASSAVSFYQFWISGQKKKERIVISASFKVVFTVKGLCPSAPPVNTEAKCLFISADDQLPYSQAYHTHARAKRKRARQRESIKLLPLSLEQILNSIYVKKRAYVSFSCFHFPLMQMSFRIHTKACTPAQTHTWQRALRITLCFSRSGNRKTAPGLRGLVRKMSFWS